MKERTVDSRAALLWVKQSAGVLSGLCLNILREVSGYLQPLPLLPFLDEQELSFFNCHTQRWGPCMSLDLCIQLSFGSRWACFPSDKVVLCGGGDECKC